MKVRKQIAGWLFLLLFSLPFAGVGTFMGYLTVSCLVQWHQMQSWIEIPATILASDLKTSHSDDSTTYKVTARYQYTYEGQSYTGNRVTMHSDSDNIGSFHQRTHETLQRHRKSNEPFPCYVNPEDPTQATLFRKPRWTNLFFYLLFVLLFGGFGYGMLIGVFWNRRKQRQKEKLKQQHPDEPWLWNPQWRDGHITGQSKAKMWTATIFALFWNLISSSVFLFIPEELRNGNHLVLIALIFPLIGLGLGVWAIREIIRRFKFGESTFEMQSIPGVIGGPFKGRIHTKVNIKPADGFHLTLTCINKVTTGSGKHKHTHEHIPWQDSNVIERELYEYDPTQSVIPVSFQIPYDCDETEKSNPRNQTFWRLEVEAKVPGVDYAARFEVPVFRTNQSNPDTTVDLGISATEQSPQDRLAALTQAHISIEPLPSGGQRIEIPMARNKGPALGITAFLLIWTGAIALMIKVHAPLIFPIVFGLVDLLVFHVFLNLWFFRSQIEVYPQRLTLAKGLLLLKSPVELNLSDIEGFQVKSNMTSNGRAYYKVTVTTTGGKSQLVAKDLTPRRLAEQLIAEIERVLVC